MPTKSPAKKPSAKKPKTFPEHRCASGHPCVCGFGGGHGGHSCGWDPAKETRP